MTYSIRSDGVGRDLRLLADKLDDLRFAPHHNEWAESRARLSRVLRTYLVPKAVDPESPLIVVFAGPTGAGKSTLLNSVAGVQYSTAGALRPTTTRPLVVSSGDVESSEILMAGVTCDLVTGRAPILSELTLIDTPDIDSIATDHRAMAEVMIDAADVVIFVSSVSRYGDAVPWEVLRRSSSRGAPVLNVLNRVTSAASGAVGDYRSLLAAENIAGDLMVVHEYPNHDAGSPLPESAVLGVRSYLVDFVEGRREGAEQRFRSVLAATLRDVAEVVEVAEGVSWASERVLSAIGRHLEFESTDLETDLGDWHLENLRLRDGLASGRSGRRLQRWLSNRGPRSANIRQARGRIKDELIIDLESLVRARIQDALAVLVAAGGLESPSSIDLYRPLVAAVDSWFSDCDHRFHESGNRELLSVLAAASVFGDDSEAGDLLGRIGPPWNEEVQDKIRSDFQHRVNSAFDQIRADFAAQMRAWVSTVSDLEDVKRVLNDASVSALANA